jgi:pimeloyl-ACP methyl ester carboxylesterase
VATDVQLSTSTVRTADGRVLTVDSADVPGGFPVLVHAGSPGSRRMMPLAVSLAAEHGLRLISYDRPGYGESTPSPGRTVAQAAEDARAIAAGLGLDRLACWGHSGGGQYALACAALAPHLVIAVCVFASMAPPDADDLDFLGSLSPGWQAEIEMFYADPDRARQLAWSQAQKRLPALSTAEGWLEMWGEPPETVSPDRLAVAQYLALSQQDSLGSGDEGWWEDTVAFLTPWGFDPASIAVPVQLWHGERDAAVPPVFGHWLADRIPHIEAHFAADDDHGSIHDGHLAEAYDWLRRQI